MAYEYQKLSDVTLAETATDTANVLVEEGGEIKRVPKREVGGAGGLVVKLTAENCTSNDGSTFICTENYDEIYDVLMAGGTVYLDAAVYPDSDTIPVYLVAPFGWVLETTTGLIAIAMLENTMGSLIFTNGSHHTPATE